MILKIKMLWIRWQDYIYRREKKKRDLDILLFGTSFMMKTWWGWKHVPVKQIVMHRRKPL